MHTHQEDSFRAQKAFHIDRWQRDGNGESLLWLYEKVFPVERPSSMSELIKIFGKPQDDMGNIVFYISHEPPLSVNFEVDMDFPRTITGWTKSP